jgi:predicted NBD/HSP70 family sugar kinase
MGKPSDQKDTFRALQDLKTYIDDSVRCMAIAENRYGIAKDYDNFIFVSIGKGIGIGAYITTVYTGVLWE